MNINEALEQLYMTYNDGENEEAKVIAMNEYGVVYDVDQIKLVDGEAVVMLREQ